MEAHRVTYHRLTGKFGATAILLEPAPREYVWLVCKIWPRYCGKGKAARFIRAVFASMPGRHHIHFFPEMTSFKRLARAMRWSPRGDSPWFPDCIAYSHLSKSRRDASALRERWDIRHELLHRMPYLSTYINRAYARQIVRDIRRDFPRTG